MKCLSDRNCTKCGEFKKVSDFYPWRTQCKVCEGKRTKKYQRDRLQTDLDYKLRKNLRTRLYQALKKNWRTGSAVKDLGCSIEEFKVYLQAQFKPGMTWENYGEWHIDHKVAISKFDLTNQEQLKRAIHFSNLQPLWADENYAKNSR